MEQDDKERLIRVETKLDMVIPHIKKISDHESDIKLIKKVGGFLSGILTIVGGGWIVSLFKH